MATVTDVTTQPSSGLNHIDALLDQGPGWFWTTPARSTLTYTFSLASGNPSDIGPILTAAPSAFNAAQESAALAALNILSDITGIQFAQTSDGSAADLHFAVGDLVGTTTAGYASTKWNYSFNGSNTITAYTADAYVYLDNATFAGTNNNPAVGSSGFEVLLHEIGHAMGLKHPFEDGITLPGAQDNTANTLMSYTHVGGPYATFSPYDVAALLFLYGDDGLGGSLGYGRGALFLMGTGSNDTLTGGSGNDVLQGGAGNDTLSGGSGNDIAAYTGARASYTISAAGGGYTINGPEGLDTLIGIESARFADQTVVLSAGGNSPPTGSISITGSATQNASLSIASTLADADGLGSLSYRWQSSPNGSTWSDIGGATSATFQPAEAQVGLRLRVVASYTDGGGTAETATSASVGPVANVNDAPTGTVSISGSATQGQTLGVIDTLADADGLGTRSYRWQSSTNGSSWSDIASATGSSFTPGAAQVGLLLRVVASYTDGHGTAEAVPSAATSAVLAPNSPPTGSVTIGGSPAQNQTLTASHTLADVDGLGTVGYQWQTSANGSSWTTIANATAATFTLGEAQVGLQVRAVARYVDGRGASESVASAATQPVANVNDAPGGTVTIRGTPTQRQTLTASDTLTDADGLGPITYQWQSSSDGVDWAPLAGVGGGSSLTLAEAQVGLRLRVVASYTDAHGTAESVASAATAVVANANDTPTGSVTVSGTARQNQTLTANAALADTDGLGALSFQWQTSTNGSAWTALTGATEASFKLTEDEVGLRVRVVARYTDGHGTAETVASAATLAVANVNDPPGGSVAIVGAIEQGASLQASHSLTDPDGLGSVSYEWQASTNGSTWLAIAGATAPTFTPGATQVGQQLRVLARWTDGHGSAESLASPTTAAVLGVVDGTPGDDTLGGSSFADRLSGLAGNDRIAGGGGNDGIDGGEGLDTALYPQARSAYAVTDDGGRITVAARTGNDGTDTLDGIERLQFADSGLAFDLDGHAGTVLRFIATVFGAPAVNNPVFVGIGLGLVDSGLSDTELMQLALTERLGAGFTHEVLVTTLYQNLLGAPPGAADLAHWTGLLATGTFTPVSLALFAAEQDLAVAGIDLVGLAESGLPYD